MCHVRGARLLFPEAEPLPQSAVRQCRHGQGLRNGRGFADRDSGLPGTHGMHPRILFACNTPSRDCCGTRRHRDAARAPCTSLPLSIRARSSGRALQAALGHRTREVGW